ncbi:MAG: NUDIX domain-containing protein [Vicinamibacteria bacterium]|nr:NUDIX domain-containing protein [Vicinamibacteria bacterium]
MANNARSSKLIYKGRVFSIYLDEVDEPGGVRGVREVVRHQGSVAILPVFEDGRILLVRQYRHPVQESIWELPAGRIDPGESPEAGARRELIEEVGLASEHLERVAYYYSSPGFCDERLYLFRATGLTSVPPRPDPEERIESRPFTLDDARALIRSGEIRDAKTLLAILIETQRGAGVTLNDRRAIRRRSLPFVRSGVLETKDQSHIVAVLDISTQGAFLSTRTAIETEGPLHLMMVLPRGGHTVRLPCRLVRRSERFDARSGQPAGLAISFEKLDAEIQRQVAAFSEEGPFDSEPPALDTIEYRLLQCADIDIEELNRFGHDGWTLASTLADEKGYRLILYRRL